MLPVFFNGRGEWLLQFEDGSYLSHSEIETPIEFHYGGWRKLPTEVSLHGCFMLTDADEQTYQQKKAKHNEAGLVFNDMNIGFVKVLAPLPDEVMLHDKARPPATLRRQNTKFLFKIIATAWAPDYLSGTNTSFHPIPWELNSTQQTQNPINTTQPSKKPAAKHQNKAESLKRFILELENKAKNHGIAEFNKMLLDCTIEDLLSALKKWDKSRGEGNWHKLKNKDSMKGFWRSERRKQICNIDDSNKGYKNPNRETLFKKLTDLKS